MRASKILLPSLLLLAAGLTAQDIPAGTIAPTMLQTTLDARKAKVGQKVVAKVMQDVPLEFAGANSVSAPKWLDMSSK